MTAGSKKAIPLSGSARRCVQLPAQRSSPRYPMVPTTTCPDPARLECFVLGNVGETEAESLELHLAECPGCLGVLQGCQVEDDLTAVMRAQRQDPLRFPGNEHVQDVKSRDRQENS